MKKVLAMILSVLMVASLAAGCGGNTEPTEATGEGDGTVSGTIVVKALEGGYGTEVWEKVADAFEEAYPGTTVEIEISKTIETTLSNDIQSGNYPDVVHLATGRDSQITENMINNMQLRDLTPVLDITNPGEEKKVGDKIIGGFTDTNATNPYGDGKTYLMPMFYGPCGLFYNANLMEDNGWTVPTTWDEMWELGDKAMEQGIYLFTYPTTGYFDAFMFALLASTDKGIDLYNDVTSFKADAWDSDEAKQVLDVIAKLATYTEPTTTENANDIDYKKNQQLVIDGKAIFIPNGTWLPGEMIDSTPEGYVWGMTAVPAVSANQNPTSYTYLEQIWSPAGAKNPAGADAFIAFMYSDTAVDLFAEAGAGQPVPGIADKLGEEKAVYYSIYDNGATAVMGNFVATSDVGVTPADAYFTPVNQLVAGSLTVDEWLAGIKDANTALSAAVIAFGSEEATDEATEEVTDEATAEATDEATDEATSEEATDEATDEATSEEATTEAATEEATTEAAA